MKFLIDAQLPPALARYLEQLGFEARAAREFSLDGATDSSIWNFAEAGGWVVVTKDEDFVQRIVSSPSGPPIVWIRLGNTTTRVLLKWLEPLWPAVVDQLESGATLVELRTN